jgi:nitric oxide reductase subunit B
MKKMKNKISFLFIIISLLSLLFAVLLGSLSSVQYIYPEALTGFLSFQMLRPLHVSMVVAWIFSSALAGIYYYFPKIVGRPMYSKKLISLHFLVFTFTGLMIIYAYLTKTFGGREYWAYPPYLSIPILISWLFLIINFFTTLLKYILSCLSENANFMKKRIPVYIWMWGVGILFFFLTFIESYLWIIPYFRENIVRDIMVQWKSYGSLVGSWNLLVYGTAIYVMDKISGESSSTSRMTYFLFFLGLSNLILGWSHHVYILPTAIWIRYVGYAISMSELFILARLIWMWKNTIDLERRKQFLLPYLFLVAADFWIIANLFLAILYLIFFFVFHLFLF